MDYSIDTYKKILIETFKAFIAFCKEHDIKYVGAYGTVLGAVRHEGLIPWDDDIDVYMDRENYDKFISLRNDPSLLGYEILDVKNENYYLPFAKFSNKNTTIWELRHIECIIGVFIDVFPVDDVADIDESRIIHEKYCDLYGTYIHSLKSLTSPDVYLHPSYFLKVLAAKIKRTHVLKDIKNLESRFKTISGDKMMYYRSLNKYEKSILKKTWIKDITELPFEGLSINVPKDYTSYLAFTYGDYMKLPPENERVSVHYHYYIDLDKRLSIKEIKRIIK